MARDKNPEPAPENIPSAPDLRTTLLNKRPESWDRLPDLDLYMDQLLNYVNRKRPFASADQDLTKSMVNNYIKQGILPRPNGKRYTRDHIAELSMLVLLKEVLPMQDSQELFEQLDLFEASQAGYDLFREELDRTFLLTAEVLENTREDSRGATALRFALLSYATRRVAISLLEDGRDDSTKRDEPEL